MRQNKTWAMRRIIEALIIELISSPMMYILVTTDKIQNTRIGYICYFGISALIFLILNYRVLYTHFWAVKFKITKYLAVNLSIWGCMTASSLVGLKRLSNNVYTAFFGYTKPFRQLFYMTDFGSAVLFWALYLALIILVLIRILCFDDDYKKFLVKQYYRKLDKLETMEEKND